MTRDALDQLLAAPPFAGLDAQFAYLMERLAALPGGGKAPAEPYWSSQTDGMATPHANGSAGVSPHPGPASLHPSSFLLPPSLPPSVLLAAALVSRRRSEGHVCLDLELIAGTPVENEHGSRLLTPSWSEWRRQLEAVPSLVGRPCEVKPLILEGSRLYWRRYWDYEQRLAACLGILAAAPELIRPPEASTAGATALDALFPPNSHPPGDLQRMAAARILEHRLTVLLGGPGTGKTWTVARAIAAWIATAGGHTRVAVTAPTGKAVARLQESLQRAAADGGDLLAPLGAVASRAQTLHRLLGIRPDSGRPRHNADHPIPADLVVVDEASMVDLALMTKLVEALPATAHLVLLGDPHQLAAVEAGSVLADLAAGFPAAPGADGREASRPPSCTLELRENHRFGPGSGIHRASDAVNAGDANAAWSVLHGGSHPANGAATLRPLPSDLGAALRRQVLDVWGGDAMRRDPRLALAAAGRFRILAAVRRGPQGVEGLNQTVEDLLRAEGLAGSGPWYPGRPVLITANDPDAGLYNGDLGVVLPGDDGRSWVWFPGENSNPRRVAPSRLPPHETAYTLTVHKSQGSEFDRILLILPDRMSPVLTRELIYTGLTRARESVEIWSREAIFRQAVQRRTERSSGLRQRLSTRAVRPPRD
ncbi:MAG: exodeoxyribonuclease V subunit alpha [Verrucomicrobia bacterium]|nr:exodeoxyribonuclease V subunit alpha [Verrucomicrobiota bacterium]